MVAFELQLGPFAVAQLRLLAEVVALTGALPKVAPRMYVTDTLSNPFDDGGSFPGFTAAIGRQRRDANRVKREQPITVVIGNPPYKDKAKGLGGWVEGAGRLKGAYAPLDDWQPLSDWRMGAHAKHLRNLYIYFWRWASRKVFEPVDGQAEGGGHGIVAFISAAGFISGPAFERMRQDLRQRCHEIWVIDCTPEGHQPEVSSRIFQGVQQPVCIVLAARHMGGDKVEPARVRWRALPEGHRHAKFEALQALTLSDAGWQDCPSDGRAPFLPTTSQQWSQFPLVADLFAYGGSGVQPMRVWVIAPDAESLVSRWRRLVVEPTDQKQALFHPTLRGGLPADRHIDSVVKDAIPGYPHNPEPIAEDTGACPTPIRFGCRSFDRQWIIPDARVITQPNANLWRGLSERQVFLTMLHDRHPGKGPAATFTGLVPDKHHFKGSFGGRAFPLWSDAASVHPNLRPTLLAYLAKAHGRAVDAKELLAYIAAVTAHPGYGQRFDQDLATPGLRIPLTTDAATFAEAVGLGRRVVWLHTFGERFADAAADRPPGPPRLAVGRRPQVPKGGAIPLDAAGMPDVMSYDTSLQRLHIGSGFIEPVPPAVWRYAVSGKQVLVQWFSGRRKHREKPLIGDRRPPSPLGDIQPDCWLAEYTTELLNVLNVLGGLVDLEPAQAELLQLICSGPLIDDAALRQAGVFAVTEAPKRKVTKASGGPDLLTNVQSLGG